MSELERAQIIEALTASLYNMMQIFRYAQTGVHLPQIEGVDPANAFRRIAYALDIQTEAL